jgi:hypothetical protein
MAITFRFTETRPSTDVDFFDFDDEHFEELKTKYNDGFKWGNEDSTNKPPYWSYSDDGLTRTSTIVWENEAGAYDEYTQLAIIKQEYCDENGIIRTKETL